MEIKSVNPKLKQSQTAKELSKSKSTLQRYRKDINMLSPYRIPPNNTKKRRQNFPNMNSHDAPRRQMTSKDLK